VSWNVFSRKAIGYAISRNLDTQLTLAALRTAVVTPDPPLEFSITPLRGLQVASHVYVREPGFHDFQIRMPRHKASPLGNASRRSFIKTSQSGEVSQKEEQACP
jgi:putative transposase